MNSAIPNIAIIGAGASGTLTAVHLLRKLNRPARIILIEKNGKALYRGAAYSSALEYEPLNVHAGKMSAFNHLPDSFFKWVVEKRDNTINRESFVSRRWFGDYLTELAQRYSAAADTVEMQTVIAGVNKIAVKGPLPGYSIFLNNGETLHADYIVFATGNEAPADIFTPAELQEIRDCYVSNPWFTHPFKNLLGHEGVLIIGTGLTMIDHVVSLQRRGHKGLITCFSRNGFLPLPHSDTFHYTFEGAYNEKSLFEVFRQLRINAAAADDKILNWQSVIDAFRPRISRVWRNLPLAEKGYFLRRLRHLWEIHRHRAPQLSHRVINGMKASGQLHIISGHYTSVKRRKEYIELEYTEKKGGSPGKVRAHLVINCTGPSGDYTRCSNTLIKQGLTEGWMKQDALKIGIETGIRGEIMMANGIVLKNCYAVGPLRKANEWESTAIREIRTQAEDIAAYIAEKVDVLHDVLVDI